MLFLLPWVGFGVLTLSLVLQQIAAWWETHSWKEYPATIQSVRMIEDQSAEGTTYCVHASYKYQVAGRQFTGNRVWLSSGGDSVGDFQQRIFVELKRHHDQALPFRCFVNPSDPADSILYRDLRPGLIAFCLLFVVVFGGIGSIGILNLCRLRARTREAAARSEQFPEEPWKWEAADLPGQYIPHRTWVNPVLGSLIGLALAVVFPLFLGPLLFQLPWAIFGVLILVVWASQTFQAVRSIRRRLHQGVPRLTVTPWPLRVGGRCQLEIRCDNFPPAGTELSVFLEVIAVASNDDSQRVAAITTQAPMPHGTANWTCEIDLPAGVPRSAGLLDESGFKPGVWTLHITQPGDKWGLNAKYTLRVF